MRQRRWLRSAGAALGLLVLSIALCEAIGWRFLRDPLAQQLSQALDRPVQIDGDFRLHLLGSVRLRADRVQIAAPASGPEWSDPQGQAQPFARASALKLDLPYRTVWHLLRPAAPEATPAPWRIRSLQADELLLTLVRTADGRANWQFGPPRPASATHSPVLPVFDQLVVHNGVLHVDDIPAQLKLDATARTREGSATSADESGFSMDARGSWRKMPLTARVQAAGLLPLASDGADAIPVSMKANAQVGGSRVSLDGEVRDLLRLAELEGRYTLAGPSLAAIGKTVGITLPTTAAFEMEGRVRKQGDIWTATARSLSVGTSRLAGEFRYDPRRDANGAGRGLLTGTLSGTRLAFPDLAPTIGAPVAADQKPTQATAQRLLPQRDLDIPSLRAMDAQVAIAIDRVELGTQQLEPIAPLHGQLVLQDGVLTLKSLLARTSGGELRGQLRLDGRTDMPRWNADLRWAGVQLERFITARNPRDTAPAPKGQEAPGYVSGALGGRAVLTGTGRSTGRMLATLDGSAQLWLSDGSVSHLLIELAGIDIAESLGLLLKREDQALPLNCAVMNLAVSHGQATAEVGVLDTNDTTVQVGGGLSLADETLALRLSAYPKDQTPLSLRTPVRIEGTFVDPSVRLDAKAIGLRVAAATALATAVTPLAAVLALIDLGAPEKAVCTRALERMPNAAAKASGAGSPKVSSSRAGR